MTSCLSGYPGRDLNPHERNAHWILSPTCLPIPPPGRLISINQYLFERIYCLLSTSRFIKTMLLFSGCSKNYKIQPACWQTGIFCFLANSTTWQTFKENPDRIGTPERKTGFEPATPTLARSCSTS